eukprot:COSAG04_NODE_97_length_26459_cov_6.507246_11_plen_1116_part_00
MTLRRALLGALLGAPPGGAPRSAIRDGVLLVDSAPFFVRWLYTGELLGSVPDSKPKGIHKSDDHISRVTPAPGRHCALVDERQFVASSWGKVCSCDAAGNSTCGAVPGIEPTLILSSLGGADSADCLLRGYNSSACATKAPHPFLASGGLDAQPVGRRVVRIYDPDQLRGRKLYGPDDLPPLWIDQAIAKVRAEAEAFFAKLHAKGGVIDELVQDTELFSYGGFYLKPYTEPAPSALSPKYGNVSHIRKSLRAQWLQFQNDKRFPALLRELEARGFSVNHSDPELLSSALFPFEDDWQLIKPQAPVTAGGNPNRVIWNQYLMERRSMYWRSAFVEPAQKYWPHVAGSNYEYFRSKAGSYCAPGSQGMLGCLGGPGAVGYDISAPSVYEQPNLNETSWEEEVTLLKRALNISQTDVQGLGPKDHLSGFNRMRLAAYSVRGMVLANASTRVKPWLGLRGYFHGGIHEGKAVDPAELDLYQEMIFHMVLSTDSSFYFFNPYQCAGQNPPLGVSPTPEDNAALSDSLTELTSLFGCGTRRWIADASPPRLLDDIMLTGVMRGEGTGVTEDGRAPLCELCPMCCGSVWRLTLPVATVAGGAAAELAARTSPETGSALNFSGLALRGPAALQRTGCHLIFPQAKLIEPGAWGGNASTKVGVWIWQQPGSAAPFTQCDTWREAWHDVQPSAVPPLKLDEDLHALPAAQYIPLNPRQTLIFIEAENFTVAPNSPWEPRAWAHSPNYFASTVANVFHSRRAYLHHPAMTDKTTQPTTAAAAFTLPAAGHYSVLIRYEAPFRFEIPFQVAITQRGTTVFSKIFGRRSNPKVWGFTAGRHAGEYAGCGPGLNTECAWPWGATENMVWEVGAGAHLAPGVAEVRLTPVRDSDYCCWGDINIDALMLSPNSTDVAARLNDSATKDLPFDGMFSQLGEVFFRIKNLNTTHHLSVGVPLTYDHAIERGYRSHLNGTSYNSGRPQGYITVPPKHRTGWVEVGGWMDTLQHGSWQITCEALGPPPPNSTECEAVTKRRCPPGNKTACTECAEDLMKRDCPAACMYRGSCYSKWVLPSCAPPPAPPTSQQLACYGLAATACAQNHSGGHAYAANYTACRLCMEAITPCPEQGT